MRHCACTRVQKDNIFRQRRLNYHNIGVRRGISIIPEIYIYNQIKIRAFYKGRPFLDGGLFGGGLFGGGLFVGGLFAGGLFLVGLFGVTPFWGP